MTKTWINYKPNTPNAVWSSNTACVWRSRNSKKEKELKDALATLGFSPSLYDKLLSSEELDSLAKVIKQIKAFKKTLSTAVEKGYVVEEPVLTLEEQNVVERKERDSEIDESLLSKLKTEIGHGRQLQKFKHDNEMRVKFNRTLLNTYPIVFLQVPIVRNTLKTLFESIDLSQFDLKQKEIDALQPKVMDDREYNKQMDEIEKKKEKKKKKAKQPEPEESEDDDQPTAEEIISKANGLDIIPYDNLGDASDEDENIRTLSKLTIQKRLNTNKRNYEAFKTTAQKTTDKTSIEYMELQTSIRVAKAYGKKYESMLRDFDKNEKQKILGLSEDQLLLQSMDDDSDDQSDNPDWNKTHIIKDDNTGESINLNDNYYKRSSKQVISNSETALTFGDLKDIEVDLRMYLGVSDGWKVNDDDDEGEHYASTSPKQKVIIPPDFQALVPMIKSERKNEYPSIIKRLTRHSKLPILASACKSNANDVEKVLENLFKEMKIALKTK